MNVASVVVVDMDSTPSADNRSADAVSAIVRYPTFALSGTTGICRVIAPATFGAASSSSDDGAPGHSPQERFNARWLCRVEASSIHNPQQSAGNQCTTTSRN
jgi:hypothetical protein